jgi:hypothetical protein
MRAEKGYNIPAPFLHSTKNDNTLIVCINACKCKAERIEKIPRILSGGPLLVRH